jgi:hypothetical protein
VSSKKDIDERWMQVPLCMVARRLHCSDNIKHQTILHIQSQTLASEGIVDPSNAAALLHVFEVGSRILHCATATVWPSAGSWHAAFFIRPKLNLVKISPFGAQKLASEGIEDPFNAAGLLHVLDMGPTKD